MNIIIPDNPPEGFTFRKIQWGKYTIPFIVINLAGLVLTGLCFTPLISWHGFWFAIALYYSRMFVVTGGFHRYFSHRAYEFRFAPKFFQVCLSLLGSFTVQGPTSWWVHTHRHHHDTSDTPDDDHSFLYPRLQSAWRKPRGWFGWVRKMIYHFLWSHFLWFITEKVNRIEKAKIPEEFRKNKGLMALENPWGYIGGIVLYGVLCVGYGILTNMGTPESIGGGWEGFLTGFVMSTFWLYQGTFTINSVAHLLGYSRPGARDQSRNNYIMTPVNLGESQHSDHHLNPNSAAQGLTIWQRMPWSDPTYFLLLCAKIVGLIEFSKASTLESARKVLEAGKRRAQELSSGERISE